MENTELDPITQQPKYPNRGGVKPNLNPSPTLKNNFEDFNLSKISIPAPLQPMGQYYPKESSQYDEGIPIDVLERGNINEWRSEQQGALPSIGNSMVKFAAKTGINVLGGTAGTVYGLGAAANEGKLSSLWDNQVINELDSWSKGLDEALPVYKSANYQDANFLEKFVHPVMLFDEFSDAASFTAGAVLTEMLTAGVASSMVAARATGVISKMLKANQVVGMAEKAALKGLGYDALKFGRQILTGANYEASIEANQAKRQYKELALQDYMKANNIQDPEMIPSQVMDKIEMDGNSVGNTVWGQNLAILHASHMVQFPSTFGNTFNTAKKFLPRGVVQAGEGLVGKSAVKGIAIGADDVASATYKTMSTGQKIASNAYTFSKNALTEGLWEEGMQTTVSNAAQDYWRKKYDSGNINNAVDYADSFAAGLESSYGTKEGWNSIGMGMLIGMIGSPGKGLLPGKMGINKQTGKREDLWQGGAAGEFKERKQKREHLDRLAESYNTNASNAMINPSMKAGINQLVIDQGNTIDENAAIEANDKFGTLNAKDDRFVTFVDTRNKIGKFSTVEDTFDSMEKMTPEEFKQNFYDQTDDKVIDKAKQSEIIKGLRERANKIKDRRATVDAIVETDPYQNYDEDAETYKDQLVYLMSKADMIDGRTDEIDKRIRSITGDYLNGKTIKDWHQLAVDTNINKEKFTTLENHAKGMNLQAKKLEKSEVELNEKINKNVEEEKALTSKIEESSKKRDTIVKKIQKASDKLGLLKVTTMETSVLAAKTSEIQEEIDSLNKEIDALDQDTENTKDKISKNKEAQTRYKDQLAKDREDAKVAKEAYNEFVKKNLDELNTKTTKESPDNPVYNYESIEDYINALNKLLTDSTEIQDTLKTVYGKDPLKAEELAPLVQDLGKLTRMRHDLITLYNNHRSAQGRAILIAGIHAEDEAMKELLAKQININDKLNKEFKEGKEFKITLGGKELLGVGVLLKDKTPAMVLVDTETGKNINGNNVAVPLTEIKEMVKLGIITDIEDFTIEEAEEVAEKAVIANLSSVNYETGVYSITGDLVESEGNQYLKVIDAYNTRYYEVDEDGRVNPHYESEFEVEPTLVEAKSKHEFNGQLYNYTSKEGNKSVVVKVHTSPFLNKETVEEFKKYPEILIVNLGKGKTVRLFGKKDEKEIHDLIDQLEEAKKSSFRLRGKPIINYKGEEATLSYSLTDTIKTTRRKKGKNKKWYWKSTVLHIPKGKTNLSAFKLTPKEGVTIEDLLESDKLLTSNLFEKTTISNKGNLKISNFAEAEAKVEVIQDRYEDSEGNLFVIVKYNNNLYAVPMKEGYYQIDPETNIIRSIPMTVTFANLKMIGEDLEPELDNENNEIRGKENSKEDAKTVLDRVLGKLLPDFFYTGGYDVEYEKVMGEDGTVKFFRNKYNSDGTLMHRTEVPSQERWFNFTRDKSITPEEFAKKYKFRIVVNNGQFDEVFDKDDSGTLDITGKIIDGKIVTSAYDDVDVRVVLVDAKTNEPIRIDDKLIHTSIHSPEYKGVEQTDITTKTKDLVNFRKAVIDKLNAGEEIYTTIDSLTEGSVAIEQAVDQEYGTEGKTFKARARHNVKGRIIDETEGYDAVQWGIVKVTSNGTVIPASIGNTQLNNHANENGMVFTAIEGRNGNPLKVKLLTRPISSSEAITVARMLQLYSGGTTTLNNNQILPTQGEIANKAEKPIISRYIKWGVNPNNKKTQIFFDKKGTLIYGDNNKITKAEFVSNKEKLDALIAWLQANKIAHVAERFKGDTDFFSYNYNENTKQFDPEEWSNYNEYLFSNRDGRVPILSTDVIKKEGDGSNQLVQVNVRFDLGGFSKKSNYADKITKATVKTTKTETKLEEGTTEVNEEIPDELAERIFKFRQDKKEEYSFLQINGIIIKEFNDEFSKVLGRNLNGTDITNIIDYFESGEAKEQVTKAIAPVETATEEGVNSGLSADLFGGVKSTPKPTITRRSSNKFRLINTKEPFVAENEKEAKAEFNRMLPNIPISYGLFKELTKNKAWGVFQSATGVLISNKANKGTTYHEAWHVVSNLGLSPRQLKALYDSVRKELKDDSITDAQADEILADDFMNWKISGKSEIFAATEVKRNAFEKILDFITKMWNSVFNTKDLTALQVYAKINNGGYSKLSLDTKVENKDIYRLQGLTVTQSEDLLTGISYNVMTELYENYNGEISKLSENIDPIIKKVIADINSDKYVVDEIKDYVKNPANKENLVKGIKQYFDYIGLSLSAKVTESDVIDPLKELDENQELGKDNVGNAFAESVMFSSLKSTSKEIKLLIATLPEQEVDGNEMFTLNNSSGLVKTVNFGKTYVAILEALQGTPEIDGVNGMKEKLKTLAITHPEITILLNRLNALKGDQAVKTWMEFRQAFSINKYGFQTFLIGKDANKFVESNRTKASDKVKEIWNNGYKTSDAYAFVKEGKKDEVVKYLTSKKRTIENPGGKIESKIAAITDTLQYLGIEVSPHLFNSPEIRKITELIIEDYISSLSKNAIHDLTKQFQTGRYNELAEIQARISHLFLEPQHLNPENKSVYEYSLNTYITTVLNDIKQCALFPTPQERKDEFARILPHLNVLQANSMWVREILNDFNKPIPEMVLGITFLEGTKQDQTGTEGKITYDLSETSVANLHLHAMFNKRGGNYYPMMPLRRPSDKSLEPALTGFPFITDENKFLKAMKGYLSFELGVANGVAEKMATFKVILDKKTLDTITKFKGKGDVTELAETKRMIENDIRAFLNKKTAENITYFTKLGVIRDKNNTLSQELINDYKSKGGIDQLVKDFTLNYTISVFEQSMIFHGDFSQYKDFFKRTSGYVGTGKTLSRDTIVNDKIQSDIISFLREMKSKGVDISNRMDLAMKLNEQQRQEFPEFAKIDMSEIADKSTINSTNIVTIKEHTIASKYLTDAENNYKKMIEDAIKGVKEARVTPEQIQRYMSLYESMDIADGLGMITLEEYRNFLLKTGEWDILGKQEKAYQKAIRGEKLTAEDIAYFPMLKPQGFGIKGYQNTINSDGSITSTNYKGLAYQTAFEKLAFIPIIPSVAEGLELGNLLKSMQQSGATIAIMESGIKVGKERPVEFTGESVMNLPTFNMDMKYWKIQVDMHMDIAEEDRDGTQQRKLLWQDLFNNSKALDPIFEKNYKEYSETYQKLIDTEKASLLEELAIKKIGGRYLVIDGVKFTEAIKKEISSRRLPSNILNAITVDNEGNMLFPIDSLPIASKIENILMARVSNNLIRLKRPGASYTQTSNLFWKSTKELNATQKTKAKQYAQELNFIRLKDGKIVGAEIMLPSSWLNGLVKEGDDLTKLDPRLLQVMGYRIPTQGQNSMLPLIIKGFLPAEMGDTVIVPYEIVAQSGSDFDIDKLHIFRPNYFKLDGKLIYLDSKTIIQAKNKNAEIVEQTDTINEEEYAKAEDKEAKKNAKLDKQLLQNRLLEIQLETLTHPANIRNLLVPNSADFLKEEADWVVYLKEELSKKAIMPTQVNKDKAFYAWRAERVKKLKQGNPEGLISFKNEIETGMAFKGGKKYVGIVANQITSHALFQQAGTKLSGVIKTKEKTVKNGNTVSTKYTIKGVRFNFEYNIVDGKASLGGIYDVKGNLISEGNSEHLTGNVDIAKDPFIFTLNTNGLTSNVKYMMLQLGADRQWVNRFINQPVIEEYVQERLVNESIEIEATRAEENTDYMSDNNILEALYYKYGGKKLKDGETIKEVLEVIHNNGKVYNEEDLNKAIIGGVTKDINRGMQLQILADFIAYQEYGKAFNNGIQAIKPDTRGVKNMDEASKVMDDITEVENVGFFENIEHLLNEGLLKGFNSVHAKFMKDLYKSLFVTELNSIQKTIYDVIKRDVTLDGYPITSKELDIIKQSVLTYLFQVAVHRYISKFNGNAKADSLTVPTNKERVKELLTGKNSVARLLQEYMKNNSVDNAVINDLIYPELSELTGGVDLIKTVNKKIDAFTADRFAEAFEELYQTSPQLYNVLVEIAALEFGTTNSPISYFKHLDSTRIGEIFSPILKDLMENDSFNSTFSNSESIVDSIYIINRQNNKLVPKLTLSKIATHPEKNDNFDRNNVVLINEKHSLFGRKFLKQIKITKDSNGNEQWSHILYKLEAISTNKGGIHTGIYVKIGVKGGYNLKEFGTYDKSVDVTNNADINTISNVERNTIIQYYKKQGSSEVKFEQEVYKTNEERMAETEAWQKINCK